MFQKGCSGIRKGCCFAACFVYLPLATLAKLSSNDKDLKLFEKRPELRRETALAVLSSVPSASMLVVEWFLLPLEGTQSEHY